MKRGKEKSSWKSETSRELSHCQEYNDDAVLVLDDAQFALIEIKLGYDEASERVAQFPLLPVVPGPWEMSKYKKRGKEMAGSPHSRLPAKLPQVYRRSSGTSSIRFSVYCSFILLQILRKVSSGRFCIRFCVPRMLTLTVRFCASWSPMTTV